MSMSYLIEFPRGSVTENEHGLELVLQNRTNFMNIFGKTSDVTKFNVANDASGAGTLTTGDHVEPVINGVPMSATYLGSVNVAFESVGSQVTEGEFAGLDIKFSIASVPGHLIEDESGNLHMISESNFSRDDAIITVTATLNGKSVTVTGPMKTVISQLADQADTLGTGVGDFIFDQEPAYHGQINSARPSTPLVTNTEDDFVIPSGELGDIVCFVAGTMIATPNGEVAIETLATGDAVMTRDNGAQALRWIGTRTLSAAELARAPRLLPIRIKAGALGEGCPANDLLVSPQHRVLIRSKIAQRMFGAAEVLVAAKQLLQIEGIDIATDISEVTYVHILFDRHEIVMSNGAETESLYTGAEALKAIGAAAAEEVFTLFPELRDEGHVPAAVRPLLSGRNGRKLAMRHMHNQKSLLEALS